MGFPSAFRILSRFLTGRDFPTQEALKEYLQEHPGADRANHKVLPPGQAPGQQKKPEPSKPAPPKPEPEKKEEKPEPEKKPEPKAEPEKKEEKPEPEKKEEPKNEKPPVKSKFFSADEMGLSKEVTQKETDPGKLFSKAKEAHEQQLDWLDRGKGLDKALGADVIRGDEGADVEAELNKHLDKKGPVIVIGPPKKQDRCAEKVKSDYKGDWSKLGDIVRSTVAVDSMDQIEDVMKKLRASGLKLARKPNDRFAKPTDVGYRDILMNVEYPNGHVGEVQVHLKNILKAKAKGHEYYEKIRKIESTAKNEGRKTMTPEETKILDEANTKSKKLYDGAWEESTGGKSESKEKTAASRIVQRFAAGTKYYEIDGMPAEWEHGKFPEKHTSKGSVTVYELEKFFREAQPISEGEFKKLKDKSEKK